MGVTQKVTANYAVSKCEHIARSHTSGQMHCRARVIMKDEATTGWKLRIFGYMSIGDSVYR